MVSVRQLRLMGHPTLSTTMVPLKDGDSLGRMADRYFMQQTALSHGPNSDSVLRTDREKFPIAREDQRSYHSNVPFKQPHLELTPNYGAPTRDNHEGGHKYCCERDRNSQDLASAPQLSWHGVFVVGRRAHSCLTDSTGVPLEHQNSCSSGFGFSGYLRFRTSILPLVGMPPAIDVGAPTVPPARIKEAKQSGLVEPS